MATSKPPAARLEGLILESGWRVVQQIEDRPEKTGGCFSCSYLVEKDGKQAFLKALDYSQAEEISLQSSVDIPTALQFLIQAYNFERNLLRQCFQKKMDRVVVALEDGSVAVDSGVFGTVNYLIFEPADGDVRRHLAIAGKVELAWILRCLHHVATGLYQLHSATVAHQDLKPSNVLVFEGSISKVADLGSASVKGEACPRDSFEFAGDSTYAPPELLYGYHDAEWSRRRQACDVYHLGSMAVFFFCGVGMTAMILNHTAEEHRPRVWGGTYSQVLPEVRNAFGLALRELETHVPGTQLAGTLRHAVSQLCDPDPLLRGHPLNRVGTLNQYSLERYVSLFNLLAQKAEIGILEQA
ncbi:MAG: protein kinase domain-containing protein [Terriglobales bacterium]